MFRQMLHQRPWLLLAVVATFFASAARAAEPPAKDDVKKDEEEICRLVNFLHNKGYYDLRGLEERKAFEALRKYGDRAMPAVAAMLAEGHKHRDDGWIQVYRPLLLLKGFGPAGKLALPDVIKALHDDHPINVGAAAEVLQDIGPGAKEAVPALLRMWEQSKSSPEYTRKMLGEAIKKLDPEAAKTAGIP